MRQVGLPAHQPGTDILGGGFWKAGVPSNVAGKRHISHLEPVTVVPHQNTTLTGQHQPQVEDGYIQTGAYLYEHMLTNEQHKGASHSYQADVSEVQSGCKIPWGAGPGLTQKQLREDIREAAKQQVAASSRSTALPEMRHLQQQHTQPLVVDMHSKAESPVPPLQQPPLPNPALLEQLRNQHQQQTGEVAHQVPIVQASNDLDKPSNRQDVQKRPVESLQPPERCGSPSQHGALGENCNGTVSKHPLTPKSQATATEVNKQQLKSKSSDSRQLSTVADIQHTVAARTAASEKLDVQLLSNEPKAKPPHAEVTHQHTVLPETGAGAKPQKADGFSFLPDGGFALPAAGKTGEAGKSAETAASEGAHVDETSATWPGFNNSSSQHPTSNSMGTTSMHALPANLLKEDKQAINSEIESKGTRRNPMEANASSSANKQEVQAAGHAVNVAATTSAQGQVRVYGNVEANHQQHQTTAPDQVCIQETPHTQVGAASNPASSPVSGQNPLNAVPANSSPTTLHNMPPNSIALSVKVDNSAHNNTVAESAARPAASVASVASSLRSSTESLTRYPKRTRASAQHALLPGQLQGQVPQYHSLRYTKAAQSNTGPLYRSADSMHPIPCTSPRLHDYKSSSSLLTCSNNTADSQTRVSYQDTESLSNSSTSVPCVVRAATSLRSSAGFGRPTSPLSMAGIHMPRPSTPHISGKLSDDKAADLRAKRSLWAEKQLLQQELRLQSVVARYLTAENERLQHASSSLSNSVDRLYHNRVPPGFVQQHLEVVEGRDRWHGEYVPSIVQHALSASYEDGHMKSQEADKYQMQKEQQQQKLLNSSLDSLMQLIRHVKGDSNSGSRTVAREGHIPWEAVMTKQAELQATIKLHAQETAGSKAVSASERDQLISTHSQPQTMSSVAAGPVTHTLPIRSTVSSKPAHTADKHIDNHTRDDDHNSDSDSSDSRGDGSDTDSTGSSCSSSTTSPVQSRRTSADLNTAVPHPTTKLQKQDDDARADTRPKSSKPKRWEDTPLCNSHAESGTRATCTTQSCTLSAKKTSSSRSAPTTNQRFEAALQQLLQPPVHGPQWVVYETARRPLPQDHADSQHPETHAGKQLLMHEMVQHADNGNESETYSHWAGRTVRDRLLQLENTAVTMKKNGCWDIQPIAWQEADDELQATADKIDSILAAQECKQEESFD